MEKLNFDEVRSIQLEMLEKFAAFCEKNNLRYFLDAGTLLGAIRHQGFIPWDDDVDVGMPRPDYERFIKLAKNGFGHSLVLSEPEDGIYPMLKIVDSETLMIEFPDTIRNEIGVYIDVFPKDGLPNEGFYSKYLCKKVRLLILVNWFNKVSIFKWRNEKNFLKKVFAFTGRFLINDRNKNWALNKLHRIAKKFNFEESPFSATIIAGGMANCVEKKCLEHYEKMKFEHLELNVPIGWDKYLTKLYGEYMVIPPKDKQVTHDMIAYKK